MDNEAGVVQVIARDPAWTPRLPRFENRAFRLQAPEKNFRLPFAISSTFFHANSSTTPAIRIHTFASDHSQQRHHDHELNIHRPQQHTTRTRVAMAKFKGARTPFTAKCGKQRGASLNNNRFSVLELEEPYEYFPLLKLPPELRDQILDEVARLRDNRENHSWALSRRITLKKLDTNSAPNPYANSIAGPGYGAFTLPLVSKQIRKEWQQAIERQMPHHISMPLVRDAFDPHFGYYDHSLKTLRTPAHRLCVKNAYPRQVLCTLWFDLDDSEAALDPDFEHLKHFVRSCSTLMDLALDLCVEGGCKGCKGGMARGEVPRVVIDEVESLPNLRRFSIRTCMYDVFASRRKGQGWDDANVYREGGKNDTSRTGVVWDFLEDMGVIVRETDGDRPNTPRKRAF